MTAVPLARTERPRNDGSVLRAWVADLPWKQQSVLLSGLRGPDERRCPEVKKVIRFLRAATQNDAGVTAEDSYLDGGSLDDVNTRGVLREVEYLSVHFATHLLYALLIVACGCPDGDVAEQAGDLYDAIVDDWHLNPETREQMEARLA